MSKKSEQILSWTISFFMIFFLVFNGWPKNVKADVNNNYVAISAGYNYTVALDSNGKVWSWGDNSHGQLGTGDNADRNISTEVLIPAKIISISAGEYNTEAIDSNGHVWSWGDNSHGQLGTGDNAAKNTPTEISIPANIDIVSISAGEYSTEAIDSNGNVWSWGQNDYGQLGTGDNTGRNIPTEISISTNIVSISAGAEHTEAIDENGNVWSWGQNFYSQLGTGDNTDRNTPTEILMPANIVSISARVWDTEALDSNGHVWSWGWNQYGQLGTGDNTDRNTPTEISIPAQISSITTGDLHSLALDTSGGIWSFGDNSSGQLGTGDNTGRNKPTEILIPGLNSSKIKAISTGSDFTATLDDEGKIWSFGDNSSGQLGTGDNISSNVPVNINDADNVSLDKASLEIGYASGDNSSSVTQNITLPDSGANGTNISWASSNEAVISNTGVVTRPPIGSINETVSLTATITKGSYTSTKDFTVTVPEKPISITSVSFPQDGTYKAGDNLDFSLNFSGNVKVNSASGTPYLPINISSKPVEAHYISGSGTSSLIFRYTIANGDDSSGISVGNSLSLNGGNIISGDAAGVPCDITFSGRALPNIIIDTEPPIPPTQTGVTLNLKFTGQNSQSSTVNVPNFNFTSTAASNGLKQYEFDLPEGKVSEIENAGLQTNSSSVEIMDGNNNSIGEVEFTSTVILQISILNTGNTMFPVTINGNNNFPTKTYMANLNITTLGNNKHFNVSFTEVSVPSVPTNVRAVAGDGCATVSFAPSASNGGFIAVNYVVTSNPGGITGTSTGDPVTITGLNNGMQYTFTVKAVNMIGESAESLPSNSVTPSEGLVISNVNPSNGTVAAPYSFDFSASGGVGSKVYSLESGNLPNGLTLAPNGTLFGTPTSAGTFNFKIKVTDDLGQTSDNSFTMVVNASVPSAPTNVTASAGNGCAVVSFVSPSNTGGSSITGYKVISNTGAVVATGTSSPMTVSGLTNGVAYNFKVIATNAEGDSLPSAVSNSVTPSAPYIPPYVPPTTPQPVTETRIVPVTVKVGNNEFTLGNVTVVRTINTNGTINDEITLDESSVSQIVANALKDNAASIDIILNDSVSSEANSVEFQADGNCTKLLQENKLSLNVETVKGSINLPYATLMQLTGTIVQGTFSEISDSSTQGLISEYAAGAKQIGTSLKLDTNFSGAAEVMIPITADELQKGSGDASFLSNLAVMVQHSDGENEVVTGTIVYDSNNKPVGVKIPVKKFSIFTLIELPDSTNDGSAKVIPYKVNGDKVWTVNFSNDIDETTVNKDNVYVLDDEGNKVDVRLEVSGKVLTISPVENYKSGHKYQLYISDKLQSVTKVKLTKGLEYEFNII